MARHHLSTIHQWLHRVEREGPDGRHDWWDPRRSHPITPEQERAAEEDLDEPPSESGFDAVVISSIINSCRVPSPFYAQI